MKAKVLEFLQGGVVLPEERYNEAMSLYRRSEGKSVAAVNFYNRAGFTGENLKNLCYDLQQLHGITDIEIATPIVAAEKEVAGKAAAEKLAAEQLQIEAAAQLLAFDIETADYGTAKKLANTLKLDLEDQKAETIYAALEVAKTAAIAQLQVAGAVVVGFGAKVTVADQLHDATADVKAGLKLIEEFPFLDDEDCPDKLKILVQDKFTAYRDYRKTHEKLFMLTEDNGTERAMTDGEIFELAKTAIEKFELNHLIYDELEYYRDKKEILGNHPIFADEVLKEAVAAMTEKKAVTRRNTLRSYVSKETKKLKKPELTEEKGKVITEKLKQYNHELELINSRFGW